MMFYLNWQSYDLKAFSITQPDFQIIQKNNYNIIVQKLYKIGSSVP